MSERPAEPFKELHFADAPEVSGRVPGPASQQMLAEQAAIESNAAATRAACRWRGRRAGARR